ncbi:MAG: magnesium transporter CorA [Lachnospiraceae bacterium]|nr:magnesium transporter CorA [Lachnospiraceae bacterium]
MKYYQIRELLTPCSEEDIRDRSFQYVAVLNSAEWKEKSEQFDMTIDIELDPKNVLETKAIVNYDSLTGTFFVPDRTDITGKQNTFAFALDEKGIVLIDDDEYVENLVESVRKQKKWRLPSQERFLYDLLEQMIGPDLRLLEETEHRLNLAEEEILQGETEEYPKEINDIRGELLDLRMHYEQLVDLGQELEENENGFFRQENLRFFRLFTERVMRLQDRVTSLREYVVQLRDLVQSQQAERQNRIMTLLTVVATIFMPLTLIAGWYGMNFRYMPELEWKWAYLGVFVLSIAIVVGCLIWFKRKHWL